MHLEDLEGISVYCYYYRADGQLGRITDQEGNSVRPAWVDDELWNSLDQDHA